jgi:polysaccharide export outer membrane protein
MKTHRIHYFAAAFLLVITVLLAPAALAQTGGDYVIGAGDRLAVSVWGEESLNFQALVRPDGKITVPGVGDVTADGLTPPQLQERLTRELGTLVRDPFVTVTMVEIVNSKAYVVGGGVEPGVFDLRQKTTLLQLLATKSLESADLHRAYVARNGEKILDDLHSLYHEGNLSKDVVLENEDIIFIPGQSEPYVYVLGAVETPQAVPYREGITVLDAILQCGGFNKFADKDKTRIVRRNGKSEEYIDVDAEKLMDGGDLKQNQVLQKGDYVITEESFF